MSMDLRILINNVRAFPERAEIVLYTDRGFYTRCMCTIIYKNEEIDEAITNLNLAPKERVDPDWFTRILMRLFSGVRAFEFLTRLKGNGTRKSIVAFMGPQESGEVRFYSFTGKKEERILVCSVDDYYGNSESFSISMDAYQKFKDEYRDTLKRLCNKANSA